MLKGRETPNPHSLLLQVLSIPFPGSGFPDTISTLTKRLDGTVYEISSPGDLARAIQEDTLNATESGIPSR